MHRLSKILLTVIMAAGIIAGGTKIKAYAGDTYSRIGGVDRYDTASKISAAGWPGESEYIVLATADNFPDALCAAPLARQLDAPVLLSGKDKLDKSITDEIERLKPSRAIVVGGPGVISEDVEEALSDMGIKCLRLYGNDRYETSLAVANYIADELHEISEVVIATGDNFPDALSIAPIAGIRNMPILLSEKSRLPEGVEEFIDNHDVVMTYILGGTGVIGSEIEEKLPDCVRLYGDDRYETNTTVLEYFKNDIDLSNTYLATGNDYPDALTGSALAAKYSAPIVLVDETPGESTLGFVADNRLLIKDITAIGGEGVIPGSAIEPLLPRIASIEDITDTVDEGEEYELPSTVKARLDNGRYRDVAVTWKPASVDTTTGVVQKFKGSVKGYSSSINLNLIIKHKIMGKSLLTAEDLTAYVKKYNPDLNPEIAKAFIEIGKKYGMRGDIVFCQSIHETNYFKFTGDVKPEQNNFAGIGATGGGNPGNSFATIEEGVTAQMQHLLAYASTDPIPKGEVLVDPRFELIKVRGTAPYWEDLGGKWAAPGYDRNVYSSFDEALLDGKTYGQSIVSLYQRIMDSVQ